ncbi:MAG: peptide-binding protein, partial [Patescibacteria group bacterium]|nr:peptide-binding protein [Patescibacteria group bacterium]
AIYDIPLDPDQYSLWHSMQTESNISKYANPRIDKLLEDGRVTIDIQERKKIYLDFQRFLLEDAPCVFLYHPEYYSIVRGRG